VSKLSDRHKRVSGLFEVVCWAVGASVHFIRGMWQLSPELYVFSPEQAGIVIGREGMTSRALAHLWRILCRVGEVPSNTIVEFRVLVAPEGKGKHPEPVGLGDLLQAILAILDIKGAVLEISETEGSAAIAINATPETADKGFPFRDVRQIVQLWGLRNGKIVSVSVHGFINERLEGSGNGNPSWERHLDD